MGSVNRIRLRSCAIISQQTNRTRNSFADNHSFGTYTKTRHPASKKIN